MRTIAIIGGGFSGSILAAQLLRRGRTPCRVVLIEKNGRPGPGLAYGTTHVAHLLNVPAGKMSALAEDPDHFLRWARKSSLQTAADSFLPRRLYGEYISHTLDEAREYSSLRLEICREQAASLDERDGQLLVRFDGGGVLEADFVVLAMGNYPPSRPFDVEPGAEEHPGFIADYWSARERRIEPDASILAVGSGLTMVDAVLELASKKHRGPNCAVSRHGILPGRHELPFRSYPFFMTPLPDSARALLRLTRREVEKAEANGFAWQSVVDSIRPRTNAIWARLDPAEKERFLRHVRPYWDAHRHRMPPEISDAVSRLRDGGGLALKAARVRRVSVSPRKRLRVELSPRSSPKIEIVDVDCVINCTGPENDLGRTKSPLVASLLKHWTLLDPLRMGFRVNPDSGAVVDARGRESKRLFALGSLRRGTLWETTAVPELREQVRRTADDLLALSA